MRASGMGVSEAGVSGLGDACRGAAGVSDGLGADSPGALGPATFSGRTNDAG